jgi:8-oxo-dGTP diphosphatase
MTVTTRKPTGRLQYPILPYDFPSWLIAHKKEETLPPTMKDRIWSVLAGEPGGEWLKFCDKLIRTADIAVIKAGSILLIQRRKEPFKDMWALPGGKVNEGESLRRAAVRELREEAGLCGLTLQQVGIFSAHDRDPRPGWWVGTVFLAIVPEHIDITPIAGSDAKEARWFDLEALPALAFDHREIIAMIMKKHEHARRSS